MPAPFSSALLALSPAVAPENPNAWVYFDARDTPGGPRLVVDQGEGARKEARPEADTVLISYLADRAWGALPHLSVSRSDTNRVLLRFGTEGLAPV
ncbi:MAG: hypothetical protein ACREIU_01505, partial [Planctomycetota bacterium]